MPNLTEIYVEEHAIVDQLKGEYISLTSAAIEEDTISPVGAETKLYAIFPRRDGISLQVSLQKGRPVEIENVGHVWASIELNSHSDPVIPPSRVYPDVLGDNGRLETVPSNSVSIRVSLEHLFRHETNNIAIR